MYYNYACTYAYTETTIESTHTTKYVFYSAQDALDIYSVSEGTAVDSVKKEELIKHVELDEETSQKIEQLFGGEKEIYDSNTDGCQTDRMYEIVEGY